MRKVKRSIVYIRVSTSKQTPELQLRDLKTLKPPADAEIFRERRSAWRENAKRPAFAKILTLIKAGRVKKLFVWHLDRLYRNYQKLIDFLKLCKSQNVQVISFNQQWLRNMNKIPAPFDEIMFIFIGWSAENESSLKSKRVKMAVVRKSKGTFSYKRKKWGRRAYGKQIIRRVKALRKNGLSIRRIANNVKVKFKKKRSRAISKSYVHRVLTS